jgi:ATP-binding cassette subfamily C (CFTR/MRP) protein 1
MVWTDKRVGLMNEIINSMQMIKFMAWERPFRVSVEKTSNCVQPSLLGKSPD